MNPHRSERKERKHNARLHFQGMDVDLGLQFFCLLFVVCSWGVHVSIPISPALKMKRPIELQLPAPCKHDVTQNVFPFIPPNSGISGGMWTIYDEIN